MSIICCENLSKKYMVASKQSGLFGSLKQFIKPQREEVIAINNIDISIDKGTAVGILGMNGAGKSTFVKLMTGIIAPTSGKVFVDNQNPFKKDYNFCKKISLVSSNKSQLHIDLSAEDNFLFLKEIYEIDDKTYSNNLGNLTEQLNIKGLIKRPIRKLSFGERIKVELAASLLHSPKIIFLDEPTIGMDVKAQYEVRKFLNNYVLNENCTIVLTSHNMEDITKVCSKIIVIDRGQKLFYGSIFDFCKDYRDNKCIEVFFECITDKIISEMQRLGETEAIYLENKIILTVKMQSVNETLKVLLNIFGNSITNIIMQEESLESLLKRKLICG